MRTLLINCLLFVVAFLSACSPKSESHYPECKNVIEISENEPAVEYFTLKKIDLPVKYAGGEYFVYNDSIAIIVNSKNPHPFIVTFYNLNTKEEIAGYFKKGNGPSEMLNVAADLKRNYLYVSDYSLNTDTRVNIDSVLIKKNDYAPVFVHFDSSIRSDAFEYVADDTITAINEWYMKGFGASELPEFVQYDAKTGEPFAEIEENTDIYPGTPYGRSMAYTNAGYIVFWARFPVVTVYDKSFKMTKIYKDPYYDFPKLTQVNNSPMLWEDGDSFFFNFGTQTNNFIFANSPRFRVPSGNSKIEFYKSQDFAKKLYEKYEIFCFDNNFNLVRRFKPQNGIIYPHGISYCEQSGNMYITSMDEDEDYCLYKCIFEK